MDCNIAYKILTHALNEWEKIEISVEGFSMLPLISNGDVVTIQKTNNYNVGDIIIFINNKNLLIHRLVKIKGNIFFCKGDNSLGLEPVLQNDIIGKAILLNNQSIPPVSEQIIKLSFLVNRVFKNNKYNILETKKSGIYKFYYKKIRNLDYDDLKFEIKDGIKQELNLYKGFLENIKHIVHRNYLYEISKDIFYYLSVAHTMSELTIYLNEKYGDNSLLIQKDVDSILTEMIISNLINICV